MSCSVDHADRDHSPYLKKFDSGTNSDFGHELLTFSSYVMLKSLEKEEDSASVRALLVACNASSSSLARAQHLHIALIFRARSPREGCTCKTLNDYLSGCNTLLSGKARQ